MDEFDQKFELASDPFDLVAELVIEKFKNEALQDALVQLTAPESVPKPPAPKPPGSLLSTEEAAAYLAINPETLRRLCKKGVVTFIRVTPSEYRFRLIDLDEYIASRTNRRRKFV